MKGKKSVLIPFYVYSLLASEFNLDSVITLRKDIGRFWLYCHDRCPALTHKYSICTETKLGCEVTYEFFLLGCQLKYPSGENRTQGFIPSFSPPIVLDLYTRRTDTTCKRNCLSIGPYRLWWIVPQMVCQLNPWCHPFSHWQNPASHAEVPCDMHNGISLSDVHYKQMDHTTFNLIPRLASTCNRNEMEQKDFITWAITIIWTVSTRRNQTTLYTYVHITSKHEMMVTFSSLRGGWQGGFSASPALSPQGDIPMQTSTSLYLHHWLYGDKHNHCGETNFTIALSASLGQ